ncbi:MAG: NAD(P)-binding domain-containing protein [Leptothrix ochracea]|jgi:thioredoxin reductase (NADPH)|uniref:NAD(P)-binding domain-containing protein n=1 Tax=Leptothrix ochracea TaxID=735331 RepID=UPI0034E2F3C3
MIYFWLYALVGVAVMAMYMRRHKRMERAHAEELAASKAAGLGEPASLHPIVNNVLCIGSGSCVQACPEDALGVVGGKAVLKNAAACIGHGACKTACPVHAIELVFGTEKRGMEIPNLTPDFESNIPGIFIAGELGGMGLIRNACAQGRQAMDAVYRRKAGGKADFDVVVIGCGPAGLSAGLSAIEHKLSYKLLEQEDSLGGAVYHYPRNKIAMTNPVDLALVGKVKFGEIQKEKLLEFWNGVVQKTGLKVSFRERMEHIETQADGTFIVKTNQGNYTTRNVLLALGRRGTPRKLDVPGEETPKVVYRLIDAEQYRGQAVLVVGGGDSALEAAIALAAEEGTEVTLSYRSEAFARVKQKNRTLLEEAQKAGRLKVLMTSTVKNIGPGSVQIEHEGESRVLRNNAVIVCAGGLLPTPLLQKIGIQFDTKFGTA